MNEIQCVVFWDCLFSLNIVLSRFINVVAYISNILKNNLLHGYIVFCLSVHHLVGFSVFSPPPFGNIMRYATTMSICEQVFVWPYVFIFLGSIPMSGISGSFGNSV